MELPGIAAEAAKYCDVLRRAAEAGGLLVDAMTGTSDGSKENSSPVPLMVVENGCGSPCIDMMQGSSELAAAAKDADLVKSPHVQISMVGLNVLFLYHYQCFMPDPVKVFLLTF
ncbi:hypothetical protein H0E87_023828 [Populus deltoides]|uniref:Uncharacterized protein n=1 Tax=Populus deltoides TaxID=3696 RepID=A0A8T2X674_POPDE|nr:hypothetical protein H0E87_023828 [Populus deltoides]